MAKTLEEYFLKEMDEKDNQIKELQDQLEKTNDKLLNILKAKECEEETILKPVVFTNVSIHTVNVNYEKSYSLISILNKKDLTYLEKLISDNDEFEKFCNTKRENEDGNIVRCSQHTFRYSAEIENHIIGIDIYGSENQYMWTTDIKKEACIGEHCLFSLLDECVYLAKEKLKKEISEYVEKRIKEENASEN